MGEQDIHVTPIDDLKDHVELGMACWCHPRRNAEEPNVIVHNSADGREYDEVWQEIIKSKEEQE